MDDGAAMADGSARSSSLSRWVRVLTALLLIAGATFVAAYYVPLHRAHVLLLDEHQRSGQRGRELEETLSQVRGELQAKAAQVEKLEAERRQAEAEQRSGADRIERLKAELSGKLDKQIKKGSAALAVVEGHAVVALPEGAVFLPNAIDVSPQGRLLLCQAAGALSQGGEAPIRVGVVSGPPDLAPPALQHAYPTPWALSAARAASVAQAVADKCAVPAARLSAVGHGEHDPAGDALAASKLPPSRVELSMALTGAPPQEKK